MNNTTEFYDVVAINFYPRTQPIASARFTILIPTWNNLALLQLCIRSIRSNSEYEHQIIVHVNVGDDGTLDWIRSVNIDYTYSQNNIGICHAMNAMAKLATTNYLVYMNDDMYACPLWDKYLWDAIAQQKDELFYFSSTMIEPQPNKNPCTIAPHDFGDNPKNFRETALLEFHQTITKHDWYGASWPPAVVHKKLWDRVGGYSTEFSPGFYSDPDFSMKLWQAGVRNFRGIGNSRVYHFKCKTTQRITPNNGRKTFAKKWGVTASYFNKHVLHLGLPYNPNTPLVWRKNWSYWLARIKTKLFI